MQAAIEAQSPIDLSQGLAAGGQQSSIGSEADISVISWDFNLKAAAPAAGNEATDKAIRSANMVRANTMTYSGNILWRHMGSNDVFARTSTVRFLRLHQD